MRRRLWLVVASLGALVLLAAAALLAYPSVGAWAVRSRGLAKLEKKLGRDVQARSIKVGWGTLVLEGVEVAGTGTNPPLATIERIEAKFDPWKAVRGTLIVRDVRVTGPAIAVTKDATHDDLQDLADRMAPKEPTGGTRKGGVDWDRVTVTGGKLELDDRVGGLNLEATLDAEAVRGGTARVVLAFVRATTDVGPHAGATEVVLEVDLKSPRDTAKVTITDGEASIWRGLSLTGINGTIAPTGPRQAKIALSGGWGGAPGRLWTADGWLDGATRKGELHLEAARFTLDRLAPILEGGPILTPEKTAIQTKVDLVGDGDVVSVRGDLAIEGLTVFHEGLAIDPVVDLRGGAAIAAQWDHKARMLTIESLAVTFRGVEARVTGAAALRGGLEDDGTVRVEPRVDARIVVPPIACQKVLDAMPRALTPHLQGIVLKGTFEADVRSSIDWADLDNLVLGGSVGISKCLFKEVPDELKAERLEGELDHVVEVEMDRWLAIRVGPSNPNFVPIYDVNPYLVKSILSTEDSSFMTHHGFIVRELRSALARDLKLGYFKYGASSITMQLVKNLLLQREKTLSRKLQELVLTHYVESTLTKDRLLEIYLNIIEFGPWLYGIGPAAKYYFGKHPRDLNPVEAAFFSSILPSPKKRHMQFCANELTRTGDAKVQRIINLVFERDRLTPEEFTLAQKTPLVFDRSAVPDPKACLKETQRVMDNARSTTQGAVPDEERLSKKPRPGDIDVDGFVKGRAGKEARARAKVREKEQKDKNRGGRGSL